MNFLSPLSESGGRGDASDSDSSLIISYSDDVVHTDNEINALLGRCVIVEDKVVCCTSSHAKLLNHRTELAKPNLRDCFKLYKDDEACILNQTPINNKTKRLLHVHLGENIMKKDIFDV